MRLTATDRARLARAVEGRCGADRSIVLRYAPAVRFSDVPEEDAALRARLESNSLGEGVRVLPLLDYRGVRVSVLDETTLMATGTLKAVDGCLTASLLQAAGVARVAFESGGNTGAALTAYGLRAGLETYCFCPLANVDLLDGALFRSAGAHLAAVVEPGFVKEAAQRFCDATGIRHAPEVELRYAASMLRGLFVAEEMFSGRRVDWLVQSVSAAFGPIGIYRVLRALEGDLPGLPAFLGVQQAANCPLVEARGAGSRARASGPGERPLSRVMYDASPHTYRTVLEFLDLLEHTGGDVVAVGADEFDARLAPGPEGPGLRERLRGAGVEVTVRRGEVVEKTGLMALAGTLAAVDRGTIAPGSHVLCCLTGGVSRADGLAAPEVVLRGPEDVSRYAESARRGSR